MIEIVADSWPPSDADYDNYKAHAKEPHSVQCIVCKEGANHYGHVFPFCDCARSTPGLGLEHASHCTLRCEYQGFVAATLIYDDALIVPYPSKHDRDPVAWHLAMYGEDASWVAKCSRCP